MTKQHNIYADAIVGKALAQFYSALGQPQPQPRGREERPLNQRKGATHAEQAMMGVIPVSMRDGSLIVRGKGNPDALCSSSHVAGGVAGRKEAKEKLDKAIFRREMEDRGIQARVEASTLDEPASAYKDLFEIMAMQRGLVEVLHHIKPIINIKG